MSVAADVLNVALKLSDEDRAEIARQLLLSLELPDYDADAETAWAREIESRWQRFERGESKSDDWSDALARLRQSLASRPTP